MSRVRRRHALPLLAVLASFGAGIFVDGWLRTYGPPKPVQAEAKPTAPPEAPRVVPAPPPVARQPVEEAKIAAASPPTVAAASSAQLLRVPIDGISVESMKGGFAERRGNRPHEAVDILAPRGTPIHAVQDGTIAKLFVSKQGGNTIYEFESDRPLCYYYAHLDRYVDGLHDGQRVSQGEVIGYVGTSGNAPPETPHLHFGVFELNADRKWWRGRALDPYLVFKEQG